MSEIFTGPTHIIPLAKVQFVEKHYFRGDDKTDENIRGYNIVMADTTWNGMEDCYNNQVYLHKGEEADAFMTAWLSYLWHKEEPQPLETQKVVEAPVAHKLVYLLGGLAIWVLATIGVCALLGI